MKHYIKYFGILALGIVACEPEFENPVGEQGAYTSGEADFSHYVALGNSLTAGYADNALYISGQRNSYPNILAQQFSVVQETDEFTIPYMNDNTGGLLALGQQIQPNRLVLSIIEGDTLPRVYNGMEPTTDITNVLSGPFSNMGVPGAKSFHLLAPNYGDLSGLARDPVTANPYFVRFASSSEASVVEDAVAQDPTFFSLWIGNNDVLGYAMSGGVNEDEITNPQYFAGVYTQIVESLTANGAEGVLLSIPYNLKNLPFFTTVPYAPLSPTNPDFGPMIPRLNQLFGQLNQAFTAIGVPERSITFSETAASAVVVRDESLSDRTSQLTEALVQGGLDRPTATIYGMQFGQARQASVNDRIPLSSSGVIGQLNQQRFQDLIAMGVPEETAGTLAVNGVTYPLKDQHVLTPSEQIMIHNATYAYNQVIEELAQTNGLALVDTWALLLELEGSGITFDGGVMTSTFATGGAFSLDGIHLTPRGYALVANRIIEAVNETYNSTVPKVSIGNYGTITPSNDVQ